MLQCRQWITFIQDARKVVQWLVANELECTNRYCYMIHSLIGFGLFFVLYLHTFGHTYRFLCADAVCIN